ncbi:MAG: serine hydrolase [Candidatus Krumholzibacteria bacterium]|nr:serine hydrolase [Candidatus Krumholzibacteria bacterium]
MVPPWVCGCIQAYRSRSSVICLQRSVQSFPSQSRDRPALSQQRLPARFARRPRGVGGYTTVEDLLAFAVALLSDALVSKAMLDRMWRAYPKKSSPRYGYGFGIFETPPGLAVGHSGGFVGISPTPRCTSTRATRRPCCRTTGAGPSR